MKRLQHWRRNNSAGKSCFLPWLASSSVYPSAIMLPLPFGRTLARCLPWRLPRRASELLLVRRAYDADKGA
jgi:hypothetical protein